MWYKTLILIPVFLLNISPAHYLVVEEMKGHGIIGEAVNDVLYAQSVAGPPEKNDGAKNPEKEEPDFSAEQKDSSAINKRTPPESIKKGATLKDFVPSEEIEADHAVDFPVDI